MPWYVVIPLVLWSLFWTGLALWHAARRHEKWWFILFLIAHTLGVLEILYLAFVVHLFGTKKPMSRRK
jgi:hypothetical protein